MHREVHGGSQYSRFAGGNTSRTIFCSARTSLPTPIEFEHLLKINFDVSVTGFETPEVDLVLCSSKKSPNPDETFEKQSDKRPSRRFCRPSLQRDHQPRATRGTMQSIQRQGRNLHKSAAENLGQ